MTSPHHNSIIETPYGARIGDVEFIWARNSKEFLFSNSILIHGDSPVIVDPSASFSYIAQLAEAHYVKTVLNTHYHADHRSLNQLFQNVVFASHTADAQAISDFTYYNKISAEEHSFYHEWIAGIFKKYKIVDCPVSLKLSDGDVIDTGAERIHIIHIPGHTPGHIALHFEMADILFVSDIDLTPYGPWYANELSNIELFKASIAKVRNIECKYYVPSHGERIYDREKFLEKLDRFAGAFAARDEKILELLKDHPMELGELCSNGIVYKQASLVDPLKCYFQLAMVKKHIDILEKQGMIVRDGEKIVLR